MLFESRSITTEPDCSEQKVPINEFTVWMVGEPGRKCLMKFVELFQIRPLILTVRSSVWRLLKCESQSGARHKMSEIRLIQSGIFANLRPCSSQGLWIICRGTGLPVGPKNSATLYSCINCDGCLEVAAGRFVWSCTDTLFSLCASERRRHPSASSRRRPSAPIRSPQFIGSEAPLHLIELP